MVEDIRKKREAMSSQAGIYFITPTDAAVQRMLEDWDTRPQYKAAHIFFSSKVSGAQLQSIRNKPLLTQRLRSLKEVSSVADNAKTCCKASMSCTLSCGKHCGEHGRPEHTLQHLQPAPGHAAAPLPQGVSHMLSLSNKGWTLWHKKRVLAFTCSQQTQLEHVPTGMLSERGPYRSNSSRCTAVLALLSSWGHLTGSLPACAAGQPGAADHGQEDVCDRPRESAAVALW